MNARLIFAVKLQGIAYEILKKLHKLRRVRLRHGKRIMGHLGAAILNRCAQVGQRLLQVLPHNESGSMACHGFPSEIIEECR